MVRAFAQALNELDAEGGVTARHARYGENQRVLVEGMRVLGYETLLPPELHSPCITSFRNPGNFSFQPFYEELKVRGFVIYLGKVSVTDCFRHHRRCHPGRHPRAPGGGRRLSVASQTMEQVVETLQEDIEWLEGWPVQE